MFDTQIRTGLRTAARFGHLPVPAGFDNLEQYLDTLSGYVSDAILESETDERDLAVLSADEAPVATIDAVDFLPLLAAAAHRLTPAVTDLGTDETRMDIEVLDAPDHKTLRHFVFAIQPLFGVRTRVQVIDGHGQFTVGGIRDDVRQFRVAVEAFTALAPTADLDEDDAATLWATIGTLASSTPRAQTQIEAATDRYATATAYLTSRLGPARTLRRAEPALDGHVHALAVGALADAATRL